MTNPKFQIFLSHNTMIARIHHTNCLLISCVVLIWMFHPACIFAQHSRGNFLTHGHQPGEYFLYGPNPDTLGIVCMRTDNYGQDVSEIMIYDTLIFHGAFTDARDGCFYAFSIGPGERNRGWCRTFDGFQNWERCEAQVAFGSGGPATGCIPGEIFRKGYQGDNYPTTGFSDDYGDSYEEYRSQNNLSRNLAGHEDGEVYCYGVELRRSTDYGRNFETVFEGDDSTDFFPNFDIVKRGPEDGEIYIFRPNTDARGCYLSYSDDHGESFTRLCRVYSPPTWDYFDGWNYSFTPGLRAGEISVGWLAYDWRDPDQQIGCLIIYFSDDYGRNWEIYETANNSDWHWNAVTPSNNPVSEISLFNIYPNPFNQQTTIYFTLLKPQALRLDICDTEGRIVDVLLEGILRSGEHRIPWINDYHTLERLPTGYYFCRLSLEDQTFTRLINFIK